MLFCLVVRLCDFVCDCVCECVIYCVCICNWLCVCMCLCNQRNIKDILMDGQSYLERNIILIVKSTKAAVFGISKQEKKISFFKCLRTIFHVFMFSIVCFCAPSVWNALPQNIRYIESLPAFRRALKTHLFGKYYPADM